MSRVDAEEKSRAAGDLEDWEVCPYIKSHVIRRSNFQAHIVACSAANPELAKSFAVCEHNSSHHVKKINLGLHYITCPDFRLFKVRAYRSAIATAEGFVGGKSEELKAVERRNAEAAKRRKELTLEEEEIDHKYNSEWT